VFYLRDTGLSDEEHRPAMAETLDLFATITREEREALTTKIASIRRGYSGLEAESTAIVTNNGDYTDYSMTYSMGLSHNLFPSPRFEQIWTAYFERYHAVARDIARAILQTVGVHDGIEIEALLACDPVLRLKCFPEVPEHRAAERVPMRIAPHYDLSIVTLIHQTPCPNGFVSLQAEAAGQWVALPAVPGTVVVLCGAVTTLATGGQVPAPRHQIAAPPASLRAGSDRTSSVFFLRPAPSFAFSVSEARRFGFNVSLGHEHATFGEWVGNNYTAMHGQAGSPTAPSSEPR
jgi:deacetoxycephalosporin-C synthase/deacetoxycephalosporin-C hydroxylase